MRGERLIMRRPRLRRSVGGVAASLLLLAGAACGGDSGSDGDPAASSAASAAAKEESRVTAGGPPAAQAGGSLPKPQRLELEQRHPNGSLVKVTAIAFAPTSVTVSVEAINGYTRQIELNARRIHLVDDKGNAFNFVEPAQNSDMQITPGGTLTGDLTFLGVLDRQATSLRLTFNVYDVEEIVDLADRSRTATSPEFQFDKITFTR